MSVVLLGPDGKSRLDRATVPLTTAQLKWFLDADSLLRNVSHLWTVGVRLACGRCWKKGLKDTVSVRFNDLTQTFYVACECAPVEGKLPRTEIQRMGTDEFLLKVGWTVVCAARCANDRGLGDGVEANNRDTDGQWHVRCGCTDRVYVAPAAPRVVLAS